MLKGSIIKDDAEYLIESYSSLFDTFANRNMLITGSAGFLCSYFLDVFARYNLRYPEKRINILATDNFLSGLPKRLEAFKTVPGLEVLQHNVLNELSDQRKFDYIVHGASVASPIFYRKYPIETLEVNVKGTWNIFDRARSDQAKSVLFFSSSEIYGDPDPKFIPTSEEYTGNVATIGPRACYDESKRLGETLSYNYFEQHQVPIKIVRPFNVYGPGQNLNDQRILPDLMSASVHNKDIVLFSNGTPTRSFTYVRDFMAGSLHVMLNGKPAEAYNIGNNEEISIKELAEMVTVEASKFGRKIKVTFAKSHDSKYLVHNPNRRCPDISKATREFNWRPETKVKEGIYRTLASYLEEEK